MNEPHPHQQRLHDIDQCKGLAIFLVVVGHITAAKGGFPPGAEWFRWVNYTIYNFHMPFFMFLSGVVTFYSYRPVQSWGEYRRYVGQRFLRFFPAYVLFALLISIGKTVTARYAHVDNVPADLVADLVKFLVRPMDSSAASLWYVYVLVAYFALLPPVLKVARDRLTPLIAVALLVHFVPVTGWFMLREICEYALVFLLGGLAARHYREFARVVDRWWWAWVSVFGFIVSVWWFGWLPWKVIKLIFGLVAIPALVALVRRYGRRSNVLALLGRYTFAIYLMNTLAIGAAKALLFKFTTWDGLRFLVVAPLLVLAGIFIPIFVKRFVFRRLPVLDRITT